jgi:hypothetical protein
LLPAQTGEFRSSRLIHTSRSRPGKASTGDGSVQSSARGSFAREGNRTKSGITTVTC